MKLKDVALCGILTSLALVLSIVERMVPIGLVIPLPGVKLGLSNIVILYTIIVLGKKQGFMVVALKIAMLFWLSGNGTAFVMSLCGGLLSYLAMAWASGSYESRFSLWGISVLGAICHNIGQVIGAAAVSGTVGFFHLLVPLTISALIFGTISAVITKIPIKKLTFIKK